MKFRAILLAVIVFVGSVGIAVAQSVGIGTSAPGSIYNTAAIVLAKVANDAGINATVQPFASPNVFIPAVNTGELQFGFGSTYELLLAHEGQEFFAGRPNKELRAVSISVPTRLGLFVRKSSPYKKITDLKGRVVADGFGSQKIMLPLLASAYATAGLTAGDFKSYQVPTVSAGGDAFAAGKLDMFPFAIGGAKVREVDASVPGGIRALSIDNTPQNLAAVQKHFPTAYLRLEKPGADNVGITEPVYLVAYDSVLFTSSKVSDELVYKITKAMYENKAELAKGFPVFNLFEPKEMAKPLAVPYHPGAIKFYKEKGMWPPR